jgi:deoxyribonuclease V
MTFPKLHDWNLSTAEARELQARLANEVDVCSPLARWKTIAAVDASYNKFDPWQYAAVVVVQAGTLEVIERVGVAREVRFPYVPGLLSFREAPAVLDALEKLRTTPDVLLCDGQGIAHPRRFGLASHVGLWVNLPTIGCAKSHLTGDFEEPGRERGQWAPMGDNGTVVGAALRTRTGVKSVFVSSGHRIDLDSALAVVLDCAVTYRVPVPARLAHVYVNEIRRAAAEGKPIPS